MKLETVSDLPSSITHLSFIQKAKVLKLTKGLIDSGLSPEESIEKASKEALSVNTSVSLAKSTTPVNLAIDKQEEMISYEIIYEPDVKDAHGEWMTAETIRKAKESWDQAYAAGIAKENLFHMAQTDAFTIEKTWIQEEFDVFVIESEQIVRAGTWVAKVQYHDPVLWELKKSKVVGGLSIQCSGTLYPETGELADISFGVEYVEEEDNDESDD